MKNFAALMLCALSSAFNTSAYSSILAVGPIPAISDVSPGLKKNLDSLKGRIESSARDCAETAKTMNSIGQYSSSIKKILDTGEVVVLQVSGDMICDGVHSSSYQYGIAFEKASGRRLDLNQIYNIASRQDGRLFVRPDLIDLVKSDYRAVNENNPSCLSAAGWEDDLANLPITFSPLSDGSIVIYYAAPDVSAACFPALRLKPNEFSKFRDAKQASKYALP
ncbi:hypothetical protein [Paraburkholderia sp. BCC1885]|uniref:hypothetical protein n=1 Tax=Paraburkholderia sp. BCC1885 TaxID=2562669 RepID=UPI001181F9EB|nr:hypothetical protein [Paraburkholderia sp. BCC1885]